MCWKVCAFGLIYVCIFTIIHTAERSFMLKEGVPFGMCMCFRVDFWFLILFAHSAQEKVALLIGNGHYMCKDIETLKAVESDIRNLHTTLTALEFKVISLVNLKYHEMIKALKQFCMHLQSGVYALFYYSGHGFSCNNATYLIPIDAKNNPLKCCDCISSHTIENHIKGTGAIGIALLDCCKVRYGSFKIWLNLYMYIFMVAINIIVKLCEPVKHFAKCRRNIMTELPYFQFTALQYS